MNLYYISAGEGDGMDDLSLFVWAMSLAQAKEHWSAYHLKDEFPTTAIVWHVWTDKAPVFHGPLAWHIVVKQVEPPRE